MIRISWILVLGLVLGYSQDMIETNLSCTDCHNVGSWFPLSNSPVFNHNDDTDFSLVDSHSDLNCMQCHSGESIEAFHKFKTPGTTCISCHQDIHQNYWGNDCEACHSPENWNPAQSFRRHDQTLFPLVAAHRSLDCYLCHVEPQMIPSLDCQACHQSDFLPDMFSQGGFTDRSDCSLCHAPTRWDQILAINHDVFFPINSGEHRGRWDNCSTCHTVSGDFQTFTCFGSGCHSITEMFSEHCEDGSCEQCDGLSYPRTGVDSEDCYFCHPSGNTSKCGD